MEHRNTGKCNTGKCNTGDWNTGDWNTGDCNTGNWNTGNWNTGNCNTGKCNTGNRNTGKCNTGDWNTGDWNTGDCNTGNWNTVNKETGFFNTVESKTIRVFNKQCDKEVWKKAYKPSFLYFNLTTWVSSSDMTEQEKTDHPESEVTGGYLKKLCYKEAFQDSYNKASQEDKDALLKLPNFDAEVFKEISGIDVTVDNELEQKRTSLIKKAEALLEEAKNL